MARHADQTLAKGIHTPISFEYADAAARLAAGPFDATKDLNKFALQQNDNSLWILLNPSGPIWGEVTNISDPSVVDVPVKKGSGGTIPAGQVVYPVGYDAVNDLIEVEEAQANAAATMPALGFAITAIDSTGGTIREGGVLEGVIDTSGASIGDCMYVDATTAGEVTFTAPASPNVIQRLGAALTVGNPGTVIICVNDPLAIGATDGDLQNLGTAAAGTSSHAAATNHVHPAATDTDFDFQNHDAENVKAPYHNGLIDKGNQSGTVSVDWTQGARQTLTMTGDITSLSFTPPASGKPANLVLELVQDGTGGREITSYPSNSLAPTGSLSFTPDANAVDIAYIYYDGTNYYWHIVNDYGSL